MTTWTSPEACARVGQELDQLALLLERLEQGPHRADAELRLVQHVHRAADVEVPVPEGLEHPARHGGGRCGARGRGRRRRSRLGHPRPDLLEREPRVPLGEKPRHLAHLAPRHRLLEREDAAHAPPGLGRQDDDGPVPLDGDEVDALEPRVLERRRQDDGGVVGELGELSRGRLHEVVDLASGARDLALEPMRVRAPDLGAPHQAVDVVPVGLVGRHASRRGVGLERDSPSPRDRPSCSGSWPGRGRARASWPAAGTQRAPP